MGTAYSDQSASAAAYNSSPPPDDGSQVAANKVTWATHKTKIGDPLKAYDDAINTALQTALDFSSTQQTTNYTTQLSDNMKTIEIPSGSPTISLGDAATMTKNYTVTVTNIGSGSPVIALITAANTLDGTSNGTFTFPSGGGVTSYTFKVNNGATGYNSEKVGGKSLFSYAGLTPNFTSSTQAVPNGAGVVSVSHGLGSILGSNPVRMLTVSLRNQTGEIGYSTGDEVLLSTGGSSASTQVTLINDVTGAKVAISQAGLPFINNKTTGASTQITAARWFYVFRAWI